MDHYSSQRRANVSSSQREHEHRYYSVSAGRSPSPPSSHVSKPGRYTDDNPRIASSAPLGSYGRPQAPSTASQSSYRGRRVWPPLPRCEDEQVSLAREAGHEASLLSSYSEEDPPSRGTVDQETLIEDAEGFLAGKAIHAGRKVTSNPSFFHDVGRSEGVAPPDGAVEPSRKQFVPELIQRTSTPYSYTKPSVSEDKVSNVKRLIPDAQPLPSQRSGTRNHTPLASPRLPQTDSYRLSPTNPAGTGYFSSYPNTNDTTPQAATRFSSAEGDRTPRGDRGPNFTNDDILRNLERDRTPRADRGSYFKDDALAKATALPDLTRSRTETRSSTEASSPAPPLYKPKANDSTRNPARLAFPRTMSDANVLTASPDTLRPRDGVPLQSRSRPASRGPSPGTTSVRDNPSPHRSPRYASESHYGSRPGSAAHSKASSLAGSRPVSPASHITKRASGLAGLDAKDATTRASPSTAHSILTVEEPRYPVPFNDLPNPTFSQPHSSTGAALPYPDDDWPSVPMPVEEDHQYVHNLPPIAAPSFQRSASWQATFEPTNEPFSPAHQPYIPISRTSTSTSTLSSVDNKPRIDEHRHASVAGSETRKDLIRMIEQAASDCERVSPVRGYDDWYTVTGAPEIDICPDCIGLVRANAKFHVNIKRSSQRSAKTKTKCAFGSSNWIFLAWKLSQRQKRRDLTLLADIAEIDMSNEPCPGSHKDTAAWYHLRDENGAPIKGFYICSTDVQKIELLFPRLEGIFEPAHNSGSVHAHTCSMRSDSNRFAEYLAVLIEVEEKAVVSRRSPDMRPFFKLLEQSTRSRKCTRDTMLHDAYWHFHPSIPAFTVCEHCFKDTIEPEMRKKSNIALGFHRNAQPPAYDHEGWGSSCQLYSPRMRRVLNFAFKEDDLEYLMRKANERKHAEISLHQRREDLERRKDWSSRDGIPDERQFQREMGKIERDWQEKWE